MLCLPAPRFRSSRSHDSADERRPPTTNLKERELNQFCRYAAVVEELDKSYTGGSGVFGGDAEGNGGPGRPIKYKIPHLAEVGRAVNLGKKGSSRG